MNPCRARPVLPCSMEKMIGGDLVAKWGWRAPGRPSQKAAGRTMPLPAQPCTPGTWHGRIGCLAPALALLVSPSEPLGIAGKEKTFGFNYKMGWGIKQLASLAGWGDSL